MSKRRSKAGGWVNPRRLPRGPNGRALCRWCGLEVPKYRRSFCSESCVHEWKIRTSPTYAREAVYQRDRGICAECGVDAIAGKLRRNGQPRRHAAAGTGDLWQADHIVPVAEGGGECGLDGLRTLCTACHQKATRALWSRISFTNRDQKAQARPLPLFDGVC